MPNSAFLLLFKMLKKFLREKLSLNYNFFSNNYFAQSLKKLLISYVHSIP